MLKDFTQEKFDIVILGGQSNCEGNSYGDIDDPYMPDYNVWSMTHDMTMALTQEHGHRNEIQSGFYFQFARRYVADGRLTDGRKLLIIHAAVGGTGFICHNWGMQDHCYLQMMEMIRDALALNPENRLVAFLWHQGESDCSPQTTVDSHYANLMGLLKSVQDEFDAADVPFIAADFVPKWRDDNASVTKNVIDAIRKVCADTPKGRFVETDGLISNFAETGLWPHWEDDIHFSRKSIYILGDRYYDAFCELAEK